MSQAEISLWDFAGIIKRRFGWFLVGAILVFAATVAITIALPQKYRSEAQLLVGMGAENVGVDATAALGRKTNVSIAQSRKEEVNSVAALLRNRGLAEKVVDRISAEQILHTDGVKSKFDEKIDSVFEALGDRLVPELSLSERDKAVEKLQGKLRVRVDEDSYIIGLSYDSHDPLHSQQVVESIKDIYFEAHPNLYQYQDIAEEIQKKEIELAEFQNKIGLIAPVEQRSELVKRISKLKSALMGARSEIAAVEAELTTLNSKFEKMSETQVSETIEGAGNRAIDDMRTQLFQNEAKLQQLLSKRTAADPTVKQLQSVIDDLSEMLDAEAKDRKQTIKGRNDTYDQTKLLLVKRTAILDFTKSKAAILKEQIAEEENSLHALNTNHVEIARRSREIQGMLQQKQVRVTQEPTLAYLQVFPNVPLNMAIGILLAVFFGGGFAVYGEYRANANATQPTATRTTRTAPSRAQDMPTTSSPPSREPELVPSAASEHIEIRNPR